MTSELPGQPAAGDEGSCVAQARYSYALPGVTVTLSAGLVRTCAARSTTPLPAATAMPCARPQPRRVERFVEATCYGVAPRVRLRIARFRVACFVESLFRPEGSSRKRRQINECPGRTGSRRERPPRAVVGRDGRLDRGRRRCRQRRGLLAPRGHAASRAMGYTLPADLRAALDHGARLLLPGTGRCRTSLPGACGRGAPEEPVPTDGRCGGGAPRSGPVRARWRRPVRAPLGDRSRMMTPRSTR